MSVTIGLRTLLIVALLLAFPAAAPPVTHADTVIAVTTAGDDLTVNGNCSLREAVIAANTDAPVDACPAGSGADTILLPARRYSLSLVGPLEDAAGTGDLDITDDLTINGRDADRSIIDGGAPQFENPDRVFQIMENVTVVFADLTIQNGREREGAGVLNHGALYIFNGDISGNRAMDDDTGSTGGGAGIYNLGYLRVQDSTISWNQVWGYSGPYDVYELGGGIRNAGYAEIERCTFTGNWAGGGAAIFNLGELVISDSQMTGNAVRYLGAGLNNCGRATVVRTAIFDNGETGITNGGTYGRSGELTLRNCTVSGNKGYRGAGGIWNWSGTVEIINSTIANNKGPESLGGILGPTKLQGSIVAGNHGEYGRGRDCFGRIESQGYNLDSDGSCNLANTGDLPNTDPFLGSLGDNGGPTPTHALLPGSPVIDRIPAALCTVLTDQRGIARPQPYKGTCDIGAYEFGPLAEIQWIVEDVKDLYTTGALDKVQYRTLHSQLKTAGAALLAGDGTGACAGLHVFVDQMQAYVDQGKPTPEQAAPLVTAANRVMSLICP